MCTDLRLLASMKEVEEPFEKEQIGKSSSSLFVICNNLFIYNKSLRDQCVETHERLRS